MNPVRVSGKLKLFVLVVFLGHTGRTAAQQDIIDSLQYALKHAPDEISSINTLNQLSFHYHAISPGEAIEFAEEAKLLAIQHNYEKGIGDAWSNLGICMAVTGKPEKAIRCFLDALSIREKTGDTEGVAKTLNNIAGLYTLQEDYEKALDYSTRSLEKLNTTKDHDATGSAHISLGMIYSRKGDIQRSVAEFQSAIKIFNANKNNQRLSDALLQLGGALAENNLYNKALQTYHEAFVLLRNQPLARQRIDLHIAIAEVSQVTGNADSANHHLHKAKALSIATNNKASQSRCLERLSEFHEKNHSYDSALFYSKQFQLLFKEMFTRERMAQVTSLEKIYHAEKKEKELEKSAGKIRVQQTMLVIAGGLLLIATCTGFLLFRYSRAKKKANLELRTLNLSINEKNEEIMLQADRISELNKSLEEEVMHRTQKIREQNRMLIEYAYFNSHQLRGPLASILGLVALIKLEWPEAEKDEIMEKLHESASQLDTVVRAMTKKLDSES